MRLVDVDALKDNMFHYAAPEMVWDRGDIEHKINEMPTIDAIPVEWIRNIKENLPESIEKMGLDAVLILWAQEQEAR